MNTKFKFGDRVRCQFLGECVVINSSEHFCYVMNEKGDYNTIANPEHLELVPHPDTARLDWLEKNQFELGTYYDDDGLGFIDLRYVVYQPDKQGCRIKLSDEKSYRQAIDDAMQQEQTK